MATRRRPRAKSAAIEPLNPDHGLVLLSFCKLFEDLGVGATLLWRDLWRPIHAAAELLSFEIVHGAMSDRYAYNGRCMRKAMGELVTVLGEHRGFCDLFVPIRGGSEARGLIVVGPFANAWPTAAEISERWRSLTGRQAHPADADFSRYLRATFSTLVLGQPGTLDLQRLVECVAALASATGETAAIEAELWGLRERLMRWRKADLVWDAARQMVDERTSRLWASSARRDQLPDLGLRRFPEHVAVGLMTSRKQEPDPVDDLVRRHAFQRACVELAAAHGETISGQQGDHGVSFLSTNRLSARGKGSSERASRWLTELAQRATLLAKKEFDLAVRFGVSTLAVPLPRQFEAALAAAETALASDVTLVQAQAARRGTSALQTLRRELSGLLEVDPEQLQNRFERFLDAVALRTAHRPEPARVHLETAFERLAEVLLQSGALEPRGNEALLSALERRAREATTLSELFSAYRVAVGELVQAVEQPGHGLQERSLRRAEDYLSQHYAEPVTLAEAAQAAGFAPGYFSKLLRKERGVTFEQYLRQLRLRRARELLEDTKLSLRRIAQLSGFSRASYLSRVFKEAQRETPIAYRHRVLHEPKVGKKRRKSAATGARS